MLTDNSHLATQTVMAWLAQWPQLVPDMNGMLEESDGLSKVYVEGEFVPCDN
jgi:hypothetical protein